MSSKRRYKMSIRMSNDEKADFFAGHDIADYYGPRSAYARDILIGKIPHPNFQEQPRDFDSLLNVRDTGYVAPGYEQLVHYHAVVIASQMMSIKGDHELQKIVSNNREIFNRLVDGIRGYSYNEKTKERSPLIHPDDR